MSTDTNKGGAGSTALSTGKEILQAAVDSHQKVTLRALDVIPANDRLTVYILWTLSLLALVGGIAFAIFGNSTFGFVIMLVGFACIILSVLLQNKQSSATPDQFGELIREQVTAPTWARLVPQLPIMDDKLDGFQISMRQLRTTAIALLNEARRKAGRTEVNSEKIRINLFLVLTYETQKSGALVLVIPKRMHDNMSCFEDRNIRILPHEGLTGRTFTLGEACGAKSTSASSGKLEWSKVDLFPTRPASDEWERFVLSEEQQKLVGTQLSWIVSFPLSYDPTDRGTTFGVLNIDCVDDMAKIDDMRALASGIEPNVLALAASIAELPKVQITIRVEDATD